MAERLMSLKHLCGAFSIAAFAACSNVADSYVFLSTSPVCPSPQDVTQVIALQGALAPTLERLLSIQRVANDKFKIVAQGTFLEGVPSTPLPLEATFGALEPGTYHVDFYTRVKDPYGVLGAEVLENSLDFRVDAVGVACKPWSIEAEERRVLTAALGSQFDHNLRVRVTDYAGQPVSNATVRFGPVRSVFDKFLPLIEADAVLEESVAHTDEDGIAEVSAKANYAAGTYTYEALVSHGNVAAKDYFILANGHVSIDMDAVPVVEYGNAAGHFFLTSDPTEMRLLDSGVTTGWVRTGAAFLASKTGSLLDGMSPVCRFYGRPNGTDSHFFSASPIECDAVGRLFGSDWTLETADAFRIRLPNLATGECMAGTHPVFRLFNNKVDANHRYVRLRATVDRMLMQGWTAEGYGAAAVVMCAAA